MAIRTTATGLGLWALVHTLRSGVAQPGVALAFGALIAVGELARQGLAGAHRAPEERARAPLGAAGALAYALLGEVAGVPATHGPAQALVVAGAAGLVGLVPRPGRGPAGDRLARHLLTCGFAATCVQPLHAAGPLASWAGRGHVPPLVLLGLLALTALGDAVLAAAFARARSGRPYGALLRGELRASGGIGPAIGATGVVIALATAVAGLWALPVFSLPLLLTQCALRRCAAARATCRQTIVSLARATEIAGHTPPGHAHRVAALSRAVGGELGLREPDLDLLEYAALMHDIGQLSLVDPVPSGATAPLPPAEQRRIALLGGAVVRQTGVPAEVAVIVERQADPYREQPVTARIVRTVNAYDDWAGRTAGPGGAPWALERLRLAVGRDFETGVVEALARVLARGGRTT
ncbi:HD-GYP domain-containing protein [Streptomyces sp. NPDC059080]|uniref:HD-GYP domain-containing protein n=1 Tax=Streptomyces sp. NPDC059080 TaxID=3346718 RepID=UPI0036A08FB1